MRRSNNKLMAGHCRNKNSGMTYRLDRAVENLLAKEAAYATDPRSAHNRAPDSSVYKVVKPKRRKKDGNSIS